MSLFNASTSDSACGCAPASRASAAAPATVVKPRYETSDSPEAYGLTVYLPGVAKDGLEITAENDQLRISGSRSWKQPEGWTQVYRESFAAPYDLVLQYDNSIAPEKIQAELSDGVLRVSLPKSEAVKPRKIAVS
jgi:HSP20 family protein